MCLIFWNTLTHSSVANISASHELLDVVLFIFLMLLLAFGVFFSPTFQFFFTFWLVHLGSFLLFFLLWLLKYLLD